MSKLNPISEERKQERKNAIIKELKGLIFPTVLLAIIAALIVFVMTYQKASVDDRVIEVKSFAGDEKDIVLENDYLKLVMNPLTTGFDLTVKSSGKVWSSTPAGAADDSLAVTEERGKLQSDFLLVYGNDAGLDTTLDSYTYSASKGIYEIEAGEDYIKVDYSLGKISKEYIYPTAIKASDMDALVSNLDKSKQDSLKQFYKKYDINNLGKKDDKEQLLEDYPALATDQLYILRDVDSIREVKKKMLQSLFEEAGYTYEQFTADKENVNREAANNTPVFNATVIYRLDGDDLIVELPFSSLDGPDDYPIYTVSMLPYIGAANNSEEGFALVPEGGGSIIDFNNGKSRQNIYVSNLYGWDMALERKDVVHNTIANMNVFGVSDTKDSFICILEKGSSYASVKADVAGRTSNFNYISAVYSIKPREKYDLGANANQDMYVYLSELPDESIVQRYSFIDSGDYVSMAKDYRNYLLKTYPDNLTENTDESTPVEVEMLGAVDKVRQILGVPVSRPLALTTYDEATEMITDLHNDGIDNLTVKYVGWCNGGVRQKVLTKVKTIFALGSKSDLQKLSTTAVDLGIDFYLDGITEYAFESDIFDGFFSYTDAAKFLSRKRAELFEYSAITFVKRDGFKNYFLLHPDKMVKMAESLVEACGKYNAGISFQDIGTDLSSDYYRKNYVSREAVLNMQTDILADAQSKGSKIIINSGNAYAMPYADMITNMDLKGNEYTILDRTVPFYQIAIHGLVNYTGKPINVCGNDVEEVLYCAEYGAGLSFTLMKESSFTLQKTLYPEYYGADFDQWHEEMLKIYNRYNNELGHTFNQSIVDHYYLSDTVTVTVYEDGTKTYVNYGYSDFQDGNTTIPARDYFVVR